MMHIIPGLARVRKGAVALLLVTAASFGLTSATHAETVAKGSVEQRLARVEAIKGIERLQGAYGYYQDRFLFDQSASLFTKNNPEAHFDGQVWIGQKGIARLWHHHLPATISGGTIGPRAGTMFDQPIFEGIVDVAPDGKSGQARFQVIGRYAVYGQEEWWIGGVYENDYVKEDGVWKIKTLRYCSTWAAPYNSGWKAAVSPRSKFSWQRPATGAGRADRTTNCPELYPRGEMIPFKFAHPTTGQRISTKR